MAADEKMAPPHAAQEFMERAIELAYLGEGRVEPNPMVGAVLVRDGRIVGEGYHREFGGPHAEVEAIAAAGKSAAGSELYVTLEPCAHTGKTPPCVDAIRAAGISAVHAAILDPNPRVAGGGLALLASHGVAVESGLAERQAMQLCRPYLKLLDSGRPWVIAKWAMSLDGKIATHTRDSQWISSPAARELVHRLRGRMDAIVIGRGTADCDDPRLTARPPGPRVPTRIVIDRLAQLKPDSRLVQTARQIPVLLATSTDAPAERIAVLERAGVEVLRVAGDTANSRLTMLLDELGRRQCTNVLVEGGSELLGSFADIDAIDEVRAFIAPSLIGGQAALSPVGGQGHASVKRSSRFVLEEYREVAGGNLCLCYVRCREKP